MRIFLLNKVQVAHGLSTGVLVLLTWPLPLAVYLAEQFGPPAAESDAGPAHDRTAADQRFQYVNDHFTHSYFGRYR